MPGLSADDLPGVQAGHLLAELVIFLAAAVVRRDGRVQAAGHPADHVRLGVAEERLDALCGEPGVIDKVAASQTARHVRDTCHCLCGPAIEF